MKRFTLVLLLFHAFGINGQDIMLEEDIRLKAGISDQCESLPIINNLNNKLTLFLLDAKNISGIEFDSNFGISNKCSFESKNKKISNLLGYSVIGQQYYLFFSNKRKDQFLVQSIDIVNNQQSASIAEIKLNEEYFLEALSHKNNFYLLTIIKNSSKLRLYVFEGEGLQRTEEYDFSNHSFSTVEYKSLYSTLVNATHSAKPTFNLTKIDARDPVSLEIASKPNKIYCYDNSIIISVDEGEVFTQLINIDLKTYTGKIDAFKYGEMTECAGLELSSNSFMSQNILYQIQSCKNELYFAAIDVTSDTLIVDYRVTKDEQITFGSTGVRQEGGINTYSQRTNKELTSTKQILRKISNSKIAVSAYPSYNYIQLTIGGYKETTNNNANGVTSFFPGHTISTPYGTVTTPPVYHYNPTTYFYDNYKNTRAVYFKTILDKNRLEQTMEKELINAFDKIKHFDDQNEKETLSLAGTSNTFSAKTIFRHDEYYLYGYYDKSKKKYYLRKFEDFPK